MSNPLRNECVKAALDELDRHGIAGRAEIRNSGHIAICWVDSSGEKEFMTAATPSDWRAHLNTRSDIRRLIDVKSSEEEDRRPIVVVREGRALTSSRDVAEYFEKSHRNVLQAIDGLIAQAPELALLNFQQGFYTLPSTGGQKHRCFDIDRDGMAILAMGFTGAKALRWKLNYIAAFNAMEAAIRAGATALPADVEKLRGDLEALTDIVLNLPAPTTPRVRKPPFVRPSVLRRMRRAAA